VLVFDARLTLTGGERGQPLLQSPQRSTLVARSTSQPLAAPRSQSPKPNLQIWTQAPARQIALYASALIAQRMPQDPRWLSSL